jgi:hypothetical protein
MRVSAAGMCAFVGALASITIDRGNLAIALVALSGFCVGYVELLAILMVPFTVKPGDIGLAHGFQASFRGLSATVTTAIYSTVLTNRNLINIPLFVAPAALNAGLPESSLPAAIAAAEAGTDAAYKKVAGLTPAAEAAIRLAARIANSESFRTMFLVSLAFGFTATFASWFIGNMDQYLTDDIARKLQGVKGDTTNVKKDDLEAK